MARYISIVFILSFTLVSCKITPQIDAFVTKLGDDTLAVETFFATQDSILAKAVLRTPQVSLRSYTLELGADGGIKTFRVFEHDPDSGFGTAGRLVQQMERRGDSLHIETETRQGRRTAAIAYREGTLPFIDMIHWPFEPALKTASKATRDTTHQFLVTGNSLSDFIIARITEDSLTIRHPFRGVMGTRITKDGEMIMLNAAGTTRKVIVHRQVKTDINALAARFVRQEREGGKLGELSGAEIEEALVHGAAAIQVEYGTPLKRNREIFGGIVPYGEVWRTGANRATHFSTDRRLQFGDTILPAGEYTLFTIPEENGGMLIINSETGQNGNSYKQEKDFARLPMTRSQQEESTEVFSITAEESGNEGILKFTWDQTVYSVNFRVL